MLFLMLLSIIFILLNLYLFTYLFVTRKINSIFRHDLYNDLQLIDGFLMLDKRDKCKEYLNNAYEKKDLYAKLERTNLLIKISYLLLYYKLHKITSNFRIYLNQNISTNMFFSVKFVKTIFKIYNYLKSKDHHYTKVNDDIITFTIEIEKDCIEILTPNSGISFPL
ncbi:Spo0B domain-containing protein [Anaerobranca gottschalkii]|uniref:Sensor_kinase_SpoOB-type, alpha-helical domain n=1 Tax=Anaerobranca gottschalkii DSM 13577 TaxID=1120990 RepID=A0A1H9YCD9_9FIRM|nr:Spo0B domain-containing protein [Anaerobranca gottschalkii]SES66212.1 Sensor_kinase_SpoOB-type, alpha-helical domain [Anaerobranca gottschalkii DSM 13577]